MRRARRWCVKCCWPTCPKTIATRKANWFLPDRRRRNPGGERRHGQEKTRRGTWRSRLVRDVRRSDGAAAGIFRDAGRIFHAGFGQVEDRRGFDARCVRRADRGPIFGNRRSRWPADAAEDEEYRPYFARGILQYPDAGREGPSERKRRPPEGRSRVRARF